MDHKSQARASERLKLIKEEVIQTWQERVCNEIPAAKKQDTIQLRNSIPQFMDKLCVALSAIGKKSHDDVNETSKEHGEQRAGLPGYSLAQMLKEYQILREVIIGSLENSGPISIQERNVILSAIEEGMTEASQYFERMSHRESSTSRIVLDGIRDHAIIRADTEGKILDWNAGAEKLLGWKKSEVLGKDGALIFTPEDKAEHAPEKEMAIAAREGKAEDKRWHVRKDGSRFFADGIMNSLMDEKEKIFGFIKVLRDDTERLLLEEEKEKAQKLITEAQDAAALTLKQLHDFFTQSPTPMAILEGPDHLFRLANPPYEKLVGRKVNGKKVLEAFSKEEVNHFMPMLDGVYKSGKPFIGRELPLNIPNNEGVIEEHWVNVNYFPHLDENGKVKGILCDVHEVTDQVQAKEAIIRSSEQFKILANSLPQIIWTATPDGLVDWYNDWWYNYLGMPIGTKWDDLEASPMHPDDVQRTWPLWEESLTTGKPFNMEQRFRRGSDGQYRWHLVRGVPIKDSQDNIIRWIGANTDIHDHKILVHALEEEQELRERFVAALSHDLRTPLTSAKLSAQVLRKSYSHDEKVLRTSDRIVGNIDRVDSMIQDLLDASLLSAGEKLPTKFEKADLLAIVHTTVEELRHLHGNHFNIIEDANYIKGMWDTAGIQRILENLCNNAIKYGDFTKTITVRIGCTKENATVSVHNFGNPIPHQEINNMFQPFKRTSEAQASGKLGWGIGLMLVKGLVDAHGGSIEVNSSEKEGTTFTVKLPMTQAI